MSSIYHGFYMGKYTHYIEKQGQNQLSVTISLNQKHDRVLGRYDLGFGKGELIGVVKKERLVFDWRRGFHYGKGYLQADDQTGHLKGNWGYGESSDNGGSFELQRQ